MTTPRVGRGKGERSGILEGSVATLGEDGRPTHLGRMDNAARSGEERKEGGEGNSFGRWSGGGDDDDGTESRREEGRAIDAAEATRAAATHPTSCRPHRAWPGNNPRATDGVRHVGRTKHNPNVGSTRMGATKRVMDVYRWRSATGGLIVRIEREGTISFAYSLGRDFHVR